MYAVVLSTVPAFDNTSPNRPSYGAYVGTSLSPSNYHEIRINIKPHKVSDGLILFQNNGFEEQTYMTMHYLALAIKDRRIVFYYSTGPSNSPAGFSDKVTYSLIVKEGQWYNISATYNRGWGSISINNKLPAFKFSNTFGRNTKLDLSSWIYTAGLPDLSLNPIFEVTSGYTGCISEVFMNRRKVHLPKPVESSRVSKCGSPCEGNQLCQHGGACQNLAHDPEYFSCRCQPGYYGKYCENVYSANVSDPCIRATCLHNGQCVPYGNQYYCLCPMPYYGFYCGRGDNFNL